MNRNERTPRTLADCQWHTGYPVASRTASRAADYLLAAAIGASLAAVIFFNL